MSIVAEKTATANPSMNSNLSFDNLRINAGSTLFTDKNSEQIQAIITNTMAFPTEKVVKRYMKDHNISAELAATHERELKRFLAICVIYDGSIGMRGAVDELWHNFIMFTEEYAAFCDKVAGHFIHHVPNDEDTTQEDSITSAIRFNLAYESLFNVAPSAEIWPDLADECRTCGKGCIGRCGRSGKETNSKDKILRQ